MPATARPPFKEVLHRFLVIFIPAALILTAVIMVSERLDAQQREERISLRESARITIAEHLLAQDIKTVTSELRLLANLTSLKHYLDSGDTTWRTEMVRIFLTLSQETGLYDQIRYIDETGHEIVRVNYNHGQPVIVPAAQLQDKSGRYFFRDTMDRDKGEVYVSPLDLNIEHDRVESPHKPTIRFGTPVFDSLGRKRGIIILNYFGENSLRHFRDAMQSSEAQNMLLNRDGYWLVAPQTKDEWGFMLGRKDRTFIREFGPEWRIISATERGSVRTSRGLFLHATTYPLIPGQHSSTGSPLPHAQSRHALQDREYQWKIVSFVPQAMLDSASFLRQPGGMALSGALYLLLIISSWFTASLTLSRKQALQALRKNEARLREITSTMSDGLLVTDNHGRISFSNPAATHLLGYTEQELLGADMHELLHVKPDGTPYPRNQCAILAVLHSGTQTHLGDEIIKTKSGSLLPVSMSAAVIHREQENIGLVVAIQDISTRKQLENELVRQARTDILTGMYNRRHFLELSGQEIARARRKGRPFALMMMDIDHFKVINDTYGHDSGDAALCSIGEICTHTLRSIDIAGRLGGEEFAVLLPETDMDQAMEAAERLRASIAEYSVRLSTGDTISITVSIGVTVLHDTDKSFDAPLKRADQALYKAKQSGRNCITAVD